MGQAKKCKICTKYFLDQAKKCNICKSSQSEFTHQNLVDLRAVVQLPLYFCKIVLGQAKKCCICTKYFWARRKNTQFALSTFGPSEKMQYLQNFAIRFYTSKSIRFKGIFTASIVLLQNCFGPSEKVLYLH